MGGSEDTLTIAIAALKAGKKSEARRVLKALVEQDSSNLNAWLWLAASVSTPRETLSCLNRVLALDPQNPKALAGVRWANAELERERGQIPEALAFGRAAEPYPLPLSLPANAAVALVPVGVVPSDAQPVTAAARPQHYVFSNVLIAALVLTLLVGLLVIAALLYAWLG